MHATLVRKVNKVNWRIRSEEVIDDIYGIEQIEHDGSTAKGAIRS